MRIVKWPRFGGAVSRPSLGFKLFESLLNALRLRWRSAEVVLDAGQPFLDFSDPHHQVVHVCGSPGQRSVLFVFLCDGFRFIVGPEEIRFGLNGG
jgi:hypothetical protein